MNKDEALRLALEALKEDRAWLETDAPTEVWEKNNEAITAIESKLEAKDEPVAWMRTSGTGSPVVTEALLAEMPEMRWSFQQPLYTTPTQRTWVGLTHAEIDYQAKKDDHGVYFALGALWAEAKLKDKNYD